MNPPRVIFLYGPAASGKLTIARELASLSGLALFHNHLTVDLLLALFPFGSPPFVRHRERLWLDLMADAMAAGTSLIFTFAPERTVSPAFPATLRARVEQSGGQISFVEVRCPESEIERRIGTPARQGFRKLTSVECYRELRDSGAFVYPAIAADCVVDSSLTTPAEAARQIVLKLGLPIVQPVEPEVDRQE